MSKRKSNRITQKLLNQDKHDESANNNQQQVTQTKKHKFNKSDGPQMKVEEAEYVDANCKNVDKIKCLDDGNVKMENSDEEFETFDSSVHSSNDISEYEQMRLDNIKRNMEMLKQFSVIEAKENFDGANKIKVTGLQREKRVKRPKEILPPRKSLRLLKIKAEAPLASEVKDMWQSESDYSYPTRKEKKLEMKVKNDVGEEDFKKLRLSWIESTKTVNKSNKKADIGKEISSYKQMILSLSITNIAKVTKSRAYSMAVHPAKDKLLVCVGDKWGAVGIWDVNSNNGKDEVFLFEPHCRPINCLKFSPADKNKLFSCSYDGSLRCGDFNKEDFSQVYGLEDDDRFNYFAWPAGKSNMLLTASSTGELLVIDLLTGKAEQKHQLSKKSLRCVDCHPINENLFSVSFYDGTLSTMDTRMLKKTGSKNLSYFRAAKTITTSFFSPITGNKILLTSQDNHLRIFDVDRNGRMSIPPRHSIRHENYYGRWLTTFRAYWDPKTDNCFTCGSMARPRQVDIFGCTESGNLLSFPLKDESFNHISSVNVFHPSMDILVSSNSTGKAYIWQ